MDGERDWILTRFNKIAIQGAPQMAVDKEAISLSRVYSHYSKCRGREVGSEYVRDGGRGPSEARVPSLPPDIPPSSLGPLPPSRNSGFLPPSLPLILFKTL